jgi:hypothetical protein
VLTGWRRIVSGGAVLLIHENEPLQAENQELRRYYELIGEFQKLRAGLTDRRIVI